MLKKDMVRGLSHRVGVVLLAGMLLGACEAHRPPPSGFLSDYNALKKDGKYSEVYWWERAGVPWKQYTRLLIDPVEVRLGAKARETIAREDMTREETREMARRLRDAVVLAVKDRYPVVTEKGPDVLRIRAALTHLDPVSPGANIVSSALLMMPVDVGEAEVEAQFLDSRTNEILGELTVSSKGSVLEITKVWTRWTQVEAAFDLWAKYLRASLDESHGVK